MAIQFPAIPYEDQQLSHNGYTWIWNGAQWDLLPSGGGYVTPTTLSSTLSTYATQAYVTTALTNTASVSVSDSTPSVTTTGSLWFNSTDGSLYVLYNDGTTSQWLQPAISNYGSGGGGSSVALTAATTVALGGVIIPAVSTSGITNASGTIGVATASTSQKGVVIVDGTSIVISNGVISAVRSLSSLTDTNVTGVTDGQVLKYSASQSKWIAAPDLTGAGGSGIALSSLSVSIAAPSGTGALTYDNTTGVFTFIPPLLTAYATTASLSSYATTASLSSYATTASLSSYATTATLATYALLTDLSSLIPSQSTHAGQYLSTNGTTLSWQAVATSLSALSDVNASGVADGQVLKYNQSQGKWIPSADLTTSGGGGVALTSFSVSTASASGSGALTYNNGTGVFTFTPPSITTYTLPTATVGTAGSGTLGGVKVDGTSITITSGVISSAGITSVTAGSGFISVSTTGGVVTVNNTLTQFNNLTDAGNTVVNGTLLSVDKIAIHAVACFDVGAVNPIAYTFNNFFSTQNPTLYAISGTCIAFNLQVPGHPFVLQTTGGVDLVWTTVNTYGTLVHVSVQGTVSTGASAMGKTTGTLYWNINPSYSGTVRYQCTLHPLMVGNIVVKSIISLP
jgi:hypothetical protein